MSLLSKPSPLSLAVLPSDSQQSEGRLVAVAPEEDSGACWQIAAFDDGIDEDLEDAEWTSNGSFGASEPPATLGGALRTALLTEHSLLPLLRGGELAARATLRLAAALAVALGACAAVRAAVVRVAGDAEDCATSSTVPSCMLAAAGAAWLALELESLAQWTLRRQRAAQSRVSSFDPAEVLDVTDVDMTEDASFDATLGLWAPIEEGSEAQDESTIFSAGTQSAAVPKAPTDPVAERLVKEYSRLAPVTLAASAAAVASASPVSPVPGGTEVVQGASVAQSLEVHAQSSGERMRRLPPLASRGGCRPLAPVLPSPLVLANPVAKAPGDAVTHGVTLGRPPSSMSDRSYVSGRTERTGVSSYSGATSSAAFTSVSSRSVVSVLSLGRNAPNMQLRQQCDLEALKLRYIESITAKKEVEVDRRLDCNDVMHTAAALERRSPSLGLAVSVLAASVATCLGVCIGLGQQRTDLSGSSRRPALAECWPEAFGEAAAGWLVAIFALDLLTVLAAAAVQFRLLQWQLDRRRDQRWKRVESRRAQKAEDMRAAEQRRHEAEAEIAARAEAVPAAAEVGEEFNQRLAAYVAGQVQHRG